MGVALAFQADRAERAFLAAVISGLTIFAGITVITFRALAFLDAEKKKKEK